VSSRNPAMCDRTLPAWICDQNVHPHPSITRFARL
jgi:hypothetical protein